MRDIILASKSPRRRDLLELLGVPFSICVSDVNETIEELSPDRAVCELSARKTMAVWENEMSKHGNATNKLIIGADTIVVCHNKLLGKPEDEKAAKKMLFALQGDTHEVYSGVTLIWEEAGNRREHSFYARTAVTFYPMTEEEIQKYIETGDCMDKAGAYGIQSKAAPYIKEIVGDYNNVVGLPIAMLYQEMKRFGLLS